MSGMADMVVGCVQLEVVTGDMDENLARVWNALSYFGENGCRLLVFPEMWSCGFSYPRLSEMAGRTPSIVEKLREQSRYYGMVLVGSLPELDGGSVFNTSFVIDGTGEIVGKYRKIHLFSLHGEHLHFGRGSSPLVCSTGAGRVGVEICYDLRFPELSRRLALDGAEILCISALWPTARIEHWSLLLRARAIENQLFVVGCNGSGIDGELIYGGASAVVSPTGHVLAQADSAGDRLLAKLNPEEVTECRRHITCFSDRLPSAY
jgi:omega-amidase